MIGGHGVAAIAELAGASRICHSLADAQEFARDLTPGRLDGEQR
jgi:hypothetical protein